MTPLTLIWLPVRIVFTVPFTHEDSLLWGKLWHHSRHQASVSAILGGLYLQERVESDRKTVETLGNKKEEDPEDEKKRQK